MSEPSDRIAGVGARADSGVEVFERHYAGEPGAGWEIQRPQTVLVRLAEEGALRGRVLDVGCGSGDNALLAAEHGLETTGWTPRPARSPSPSAKRGNAA